MHGQGPGSRSDQTKTDLQPFETHEAICKDLKPEINLNNLTSNQAVEDLKSATPECDNELMKIPPPSFVIDKSAMISTESQIATKNVPTEVIKINCDFSIHTENETQNSFRSKTDSISSENYEYMSCSEGEDQESANTSVLPASTNTKTGLSSLGSTTENEKTSDTVLLNDKLPSNGLSTRERDSNREVQQAQSGPEPCLPINLNNNSNDYAYDPLTEILDRNAFN